MAHYNLTKHSSVQNLAGQQDGQWKQDIEAVAMDGCTGFKTASAEELPHAVEILGPFHLVKLGSEALELPGNVFNASSMGGGDARMTRSINLGVR